MGYKDGETLGPFLFSHAAGLIGISQILPLRFFFLPFLIITPLCQRGCVGADRSKSPFFFFFSSRMLLFPLALLSLFTNIYGCCVRLFPFFFFLVVSSKKKGITPAFFPFFLLFLYYFLLALEWEKRIKSAPFSLPRGVRI